MKNESGIHPTGDRVLIKPEEIEMVSQGGIILPPSQEEMYANAQSIGVVVEIGPDCWVDRVEHHLDVNGSPTHRVIVGYSLAFAKAGDRVSFAKYGGLQLNGKDGQTYRLMNDRDIVAQLEEGVEFSDWKKPRKAVAK